MKIQNSRRVKSPTKFKIQSLKIFSLCAMRYALPAIFFLLFTIYCSVFTGIAFAEENPCLSCHSQYSKPAKVVHAALEMGCLTCHQPVPGMKHPQQKGSIKLSHEVPALCYICHDESRFKGKFIHSPVSGGMCSTCHNVHQSDFSRILVLDVPNLCYNCHENKTGKKHVHAPTAKGQCNLCHNAHASNTTSLLMTLHLNDLCVSCHRKHAVGTHVLRGFMGNHPMWKKPDPSRPGKEMTCASCHDPHASDFPRLRPQQGACQICHKTIN
ncbi:MAG: cytochrome c3 family protein [Thermodesulfovibrionales bacterium]